MAIGFQKLNGQGTVMGAILEELRNSKSDLQRRAKFHNPDGEHSSFTEILIEREHNLYKLVYGDVYFRINTLNSVKYNVPIRIDNGQKEITLYTDSQGVCHYFGFIRAYSFDMSFQSPVSVQFDCVFLNDIEKRLYFENLIQGGNILITIWSGQYGEPGWGPHTLNNVVRTRDLPYNISFSLHSQTQVFVYWGDGNFRQVWQSTIFISPPPDITLYFVNSEPMQFGFINVVNDSSYTFTSRNISGGNYAKMVSSGQSQQVLYSNMGFRIALIDGSYREGFYTVDNVNYHSIRIPTTGVDLTTWEFLDVPVGSTIRIVDEIPTDNTVTWVRFTNNLQSINTSVAVRAFDTNDDYIVPAGQFLEVPYSASGYGVWTEMGSGSFWVSYGDGGAIEAGYSQLLITPEAGQEVFFNQEPS